MPRKTKPPVIITAKSKTKRLSLSTLTKKLDHLTSIYIRDRDKFCIVCGSSENLQCGHYISRTFVHTRWDHENCNAQCAHCNRMHEIDPVPYTEALTAKYGEGITKKLSLKARSGRKMMYGERVLILEDLKFRTKGIA